MNLILHPELLAICKLPPSAPWPGWLPQTGFVSVTRATDELSIVCPVDCLPTGQEADRDWQAMEIEGPLDLSLVGILATLAGQLAAANLCVFVISTHDTDYILFKQDSRDRVLETLNRGGHHISQ